MDGLDDGATSCIRLIHSICMTSSVMDNVRGVFGASFNRVCVQGSRSQGVTEQELN